jgi:osmoprotectant transport system permease protein
VRPTDVTGWLTWADPSRGVLARTVEHLEYTGLAVLLACLVALPVGLVLGHTGRGGALAVAVSNVGRAVPTLGVLVLLAISPLGQSTTTVVLALALFAVPPLLTNTYVGMREVDPDAVQAAYGMGMGPAQVLRQVELPLAFPLIAAGFRTAVLQVVATATLAAAIGLGGLGRYLIDGLSAQDQAQVIAGALLVAALALVVELLLGGLQRLADRTAPAAARRRRRRPVTDAVLDPSPGNATAGTP